MNLCFNESDLFFYISTLNNLLLFCLNARSSGASSSRKSSRGALAKVLTENNELRMREEEASRQLAAVTVQLEQSKTSR